MMSNVDARSSKSGDPHSPDPFLGRVFLDRYRIVRKLEDREGGGLYFAQHLLADRPVAVEVVELEHVRPAAVDRFLEEARTVARIGHENIVEIFNGGRAAPSTVFLAMEYLEGTELSGLLAKEGPLLWERAQGIVLQIAAGLAAVHRHGIVHRDLKPENVLLVPRAGRRDFVKLLDFGVARVRAVGADTDQGSFGGAPAYMAPELAQADAVDHRADIYALGCVLYEMVTGRPPFVAESVLELLSKHQTETPAPPSSLRPAGSLPAELDAVVLRALEKDPAKRWPDMAAFGEAIARCRLTRRQSVRVEALAFAELAGKTDAFEVDARRRHRAWSIASVATALVIAIAVLRFLATSPGHVRISTVPTDAELIFNGLPVAARSPVVLDAAPGRYTLVVSRAGYVTAQRTVDVHASGSVEIPVELAPVPAPAAPPPAAAPAPAAP
jgi:protein kinase-like protein/PEGA domain-containing protein